MFYLAETPTTMQDESSRDVSSAEDEGHQRLPTGNLLVKKLSFLICWLIKYFSIIQKEAITVIRWRR